MVRLWTSVISKKGEIKLKFKVPFMQRFLLYNNKFLVRCVNKIQYLLGGQAEEKTEAYFTGYIKYEAQKKNFCIDSADSPNMFSGAQLRKVDVYFKLQCPVEITENGFMLGNVYLPYFDSEFANPQDAGKQCAKRKLCPDVVVLKDKIKPLMIGPRSLGRTCSFKELDAAYKNLLTARSVKQTGKAMCYFGNAAGPVPSKMYQSLIGIGSLISWDTLVIK